MLLHHLLYRQTSVVLVHFASQLDSCRYHAKPLYGMVISSGDRLEKNSMQIQ